VEDTRDNEEDMRVFKADNNIQVVVVLPKSEPTITRIKPTLDAMKAVVGGHVWHALSVEVGAGVWVDVYVHEEGSSLPFNRYVDGVELRGNILVIPSDLIVDSDEEVNGLTDEEAARVMELLALEAKSA